MLEKYVKIKTKRKPEKITATQRDLHNKDDLEDPLRRSIKDYQKWILQQQQPLNGLSSRTTWVSRYQKGKTNLDFTRARESEWQWHQLGHMQVCTSLQTDNHTSTPPLCFYRPDALPATQPTASKH